MTSEHQTHGDDLSVSVLLEIAASTAPLLDRAQDFLRELDRWVPFDAAWLALSDPGSRLYAVVGSAGLGSAVTDLLDRPGTAHDLGVAGLQRKGPPLSVRELSARVRDLPTWAECLTPAGYREGLGVGLFEPGGAHVGFLGLLYTSDEPPSAVARDRLGRVAPVIARGLSPVRSLLSSARIVPGAEAAAVLLRDGTACQLPGLGSHALLLGDSPVVEIAQEALRAGQAYRTFVWPARSAGARPRDHVRITVLAATEVPPVVSGLVLVSPDVDCRGLTARELEVLGLVVDGRSNQEIASRLRVTPSTVAAHVEHVLHKLEAPSRTSAAVRAEREGCYVPPRPCRSR